MSKNFHETRAESVSSSNTKLNATYFEMVEVSDESRFRKRHSGEALGTVEKYYVNGKQRLIPVPTSDPLGNKAIQTTWALTDQGHRSAKYGTMAKVDVRSCTLPLYVKWFLYSMLVYSS
jgi:hypothetical protein